jgi:hypothetical protein
LTISAEANGCTLLIATLRTALASTMPPGNTWDRREARIQSGSQSKPRTASLGPVLDSARIRKW